MMHKSDAGYLCLFLAEGMRMRSVDPITSRIESKDTQKYNNQLFGGESCPAFGKRREDAWQLKHFQFQIQTEAMPRARQRDPKAAPSSSMSSCQFLRWRVRGGAVVLLTATMAVCRVVRRRRWLTYLIRLRLLRQRWVTPLGCAVVVLFIVVYVIMSAVLLYCITTNSSCCFAPFEFNDDGCIKVTAEYIIHHTYQSHTSRTILYTMILQRCRVDLSLCIDHWSLIDDEASVRTLSVAVIYNNDDVEGTLFGSRIQLCIHLFCSPLYGSTQINIITARLYQCHACCIPFARNSFALCLA